MPRTPYPIEVTVYEIDGTPYNKANIEIYNLNLNDKLSGQTDSNGVRTLDRANATKEWKNNEVILIRAFVAGNFYRLAEIKKTMTGSTLEVSLYLQAANPVQVNNVRKDQIHLVEHDVINNSKKVSIIGINDSTKSRAIIIKATVTEITVGLTKRKTVSMFNNGSTTIYLGGSDVAVGNGYPIYPKGAQDIDMNPDCKIYGIVASSTGDLRILELG